VRAKRLDGAGLATYRALEARIAASEPDWTIELIPPAAPLPEAIPFADGAPDAVGAQALALIGWAAQRLGRGVVLSGDPDEAELAAASLREEGVTLFIRPGPGPLQAVWADEGE